MGGGAATRLRLRFIRHELILALILVLVAGYSPALGLRV
jgi:hypothetical protein